MGDFLVCLALAFAIWAGGNFALLAFKWLESIALKPSQKIHHLDLRQCKLSKGKTISICVVKANPFENIWFGHIWIDWPEAPPLANGLKETGFYAKCRVSAAVNLIGAILSPFALFHGQKPIEAAMLDDTGLRRDWQLDIQVDENQYFQALEIDSNWRQETRYILRPALGGKTISCRDYCLEIAQVLGLRANFDNWADFPPISFQKFLMQNGILHEPKSKLNNFETIGASAQI